MNVALNDRKDRGRKREILDSVITWIINKMYEKPVDYGYSAELWYPFHGSAGRISPDD